MEFENAEKEEFEFGVGDSVVIHSEESNNENYAPLRIFDCEKFTEENIKLIPKYIIERIINSHKGILKKQSRYIKLKSKVKSYKLRIEELKSEVSDLQNIIEENRNKDQIINKTEIRKAIRPYKKKIKDQEKTANHYLKEVSQKAEEVIEVNQSLLNLSEKHNKTLTKLSALKSTLGEYEKICSVSEITITSQKLDQIPLLTAKIDQLTAQIEQLISNNSSHKKIIEGLKISIELIELESNGYKNERDFLECQLTTSKEALDLLRSRNSTIEKILSEKDQLYFELLSKFKMLQHELQVINKPSISPKGYNGELEKLKKALAFKLISKQNNHS